MSVQEMSPSRYRRLWRGLKATAPLALGVAPFGVAFGAVADGAMAGWQAMLMSSTVFSGTAQFVCASMLAQGATAVPIVLTGVLINMRMLLMSAAIAPHVKDARPPASPGAWGEEVPLGEGDVNIEAFIGALDDVGYRGPLVVEREVGDQRQRVADIRGGIDLLRRLTRAG